MKNDPLGAALLAYQKTGIHKDIIVHSPIMDDDVIPVEYLFRNFSEMPYLEQIALKNCKGKVLDVGAGAGCHALWLQENGFCVEAIDISLGAVKAMKRRGIKKCSLTNVFDLPDKKFDTILMLMNGIGIVGEIDKLSQYLLKIKLNLRQGGKIIIDSTDLKYLFKMDDGSVWVDLNCNYYGEMRFQMEFEEHKSNWFKWLYIDFDRLKNIAIQCGFECNLLHKGTNSEYLAELII